MSEEEVLHIEYYESGCYYEMDFERFCEMNRNRFERFWEMPPDQVDDEEEM